MFVKSVELTSKGLALVLVWYTLFCTRRVDAIEFRNNATQITANSRPSVTQDVRAYDTKDPDDCPTWFMPRKTNQNSTKTRCMCNGELRNLRPKIIICPLYHQTSSNDHQVLNVSIRIGFCMTYEYSVKQTILGACPFNPHKSGGTQSIKYAIMLPANRSELNAFMCDSNTTGRTGILCSECQNGLGPVLNSYDWKCVECNSGVRNWLLFLSFTFLPTTVFFFIVLCCKLRLTSGIWNSSIFACQFIMCIVDGNINTIAAVINIEFYKGSQVWTILKSFYEIWNLDFLTSVTPSYCLSTSLTPLHILSLGYVTPMYTLGLVAFTYILIQLHSRGCRVLVIAWKPFQFVFRNRFIDFNPLDSIVGTFATFLLLSYSKILQVSFRLLSPVRIGNSNHSGVVYDHVYYAPALKWLSVGHLPFACLAFAILFVFTFLPMLFLALYPLKIFQRCLGQLSYINWHPVHAFADVFQGCYKSGSTGGGYDCRYFAAFYLFLRIMFISAIFYSSQMVWVVTVICSMSASTIFAGVQPYKNKWLNFLDSFTFLLVGFGALWIICDMFLHPVGRTVMIVIIFFPATCIACIGIRAVYTTKRFKTIRKKCYLKFKKSRMGGILKDTDSHQTVEDDFPHDRSPLFVPTNASSRQLGETADRDTTDGGSSIVAGTYGAFL